MADETLDQNEALNDPSIEGAGGTQATHSARKRSGRGSRGSRSRVADHVDELGDSLEARAMEMELKGGIRAKAAPAVRSVSRAADVSAAYVRERDVEAMRGDLEREIREHPIRSLGIALGCGYLLAKLLD